MSATAKSRRRTPWWQRPVEGSYAKVRICIWVVYIVGSLFFRQPTRGFIWASIAVGVIVAVILRWKNSKEDFPHIEP